MMKKLLFIIVLLLGCMQANAQFEAGKWYVNTSLTGLDLSHSKYEGTNIGFAIDGGTFIADNLSILLDFKGKYVENGFDETTVGAGVRYYFDSCGVYCGLGCAYKHLSDGDAKENLFCMTPEVGYAFFLSRTVTIEPAVYYDISFRKCSDFSKLGFKIGFGFYF